MERKKLVLNTLEILSKHPLFKKVPPALIQEWIIATYKVDPERLEWHAKRTMRIGGSEIFKAVAFYRAVKASAVDDYYSAYTMSSVQDLVKGKVFRNGPQAANAHMRRGIFNEPIANAVYLDKLRRMGKTVVHDTAASEALRNYKSEKHPWLAYNEDAVLLIDGVRTLVDYKCPEPDPVSGFDLHVEEDYVHQLHLGCFALGNCGFPVQQMELVKYNVLDTEVYNIPVTINERVINENLVAGDYLYKNYILNARIPEYQPQLGKKLTSSELKAALEEKLQGIPGAPEAALSNLRELSSKLALAKSLSNVAAKQVSALTRQVEQCINQIDLDEELDTVLTVGAVEIKNRTTTAIDETGLLELAEKVKLDISAFTTQKYDLEAIASSLKNMVPEQEVNKHITSETSKSIGVTRKLSGAAAELKNLYTSVSEQHLMSALGIIEESKSELGHVEDIVAHDVMRDELRRQYFTRAWQSAINTFIDSENLTEANGSSAPSIHELAAELVAESESLQVTKQP